MKYFDALFISNKSYFIEEKDVDSWWVKCISLNNYGTPVPYSRVVHFSRSKEAAEMWIAEKKSR